MMAYPSDITEGVPAQFQGNLQFVPDSAYSGGGYYSAPGRGYDYTYAQLERIWLDAGGDPSAAGDMAYIAKYDESGGYAGAWNTSGATGLWQEEWPLNYGSANDPATREKLFNPSVNAKVAAGQFASSGYSAWGSDQHKDLGIPPARKGSVPFENVNKGGNSGSGPDPSGGDGTDAAPVSVLPGWLNDITSLFGFNVNQDAGNAKADVTDLIERGALMVLGFVLIVVGVFVTFRQTPPAFQPKTEPSESSESSDKPYKSEAGKRQYENWQDRETKKAYDKRRLNVDEQDRQDVDEQDRQSVKPAAKRSVVPTTKMTDKQRKEVPF